MTPTRPAASRWPIAIKMFTKEDMRPELAANALPAHGLAPFIAVAPAVGGLRRDPVRRQLSASWGVDDLSLVVADLDWGVLYLFAIGSTRDLRLDAGWLGRVNNNWGDPRLACALHCPR